MLTPIENRGINYFDTTESKFIYLKLSENLAGIFSSMREKNIILSKPRDAARSFRSDDPLLIRIDELIRLGEQLIAYKDINTLIHHCQSLGPDSDIVIIYQRLQIIAADWRVSEEVAYKLLIEKHHDLFDNVDDVNSLINEPWPWP